MKGPYLPLPTYSSLSSISPTNVFLDLLDILGLFFICAFTI